MLLCDYIDGAILLEYCDDFYVVTIKWYDIYIGYRMKKTYLCINQGNMFPWFMTLIHVH